MFSKENFDENALTEMIWSAMDKYDGDTRFNKYIWISYDSLEAEYGSCDKSDFDNLTNGFVVEITDEPEEDIWESLVRSFVDFFNYNFNRTFEYDEWYDPLIEFHDEKVFNQDQLYSIFESCHSICLRNRYEDDPYYIMIDMENYRAVKSIKDIEVAEDKYVFMPVEPSKEHGLTDVYSDCSYAIEEFFETEFEMNMMYDFQIYDED